MAAPDTGYVPPEQRARQRIDAMLEAAGWAVQGYRQVNLHAAQGVAVREVPTAAGPADYMLFVDQQAVGVVEAKKAGTTLAGVEPQTLKYQANALPGIPAFAPDDLPAPAVIAAEIVGDLQAALAEFAELAESLQASDLTERSTQP